MITLLVELVAQIQKKNIQHSIEIKKTQSINANAKSR
jgi:hypothetical protein